MRTQTSNPIFDKSDFGDGRAPLEPGGARPRSSRREAEVPDPRRDTDRRSRSAKLDGEKQETSPTHMNRAALVAECEGLRAEIIRARDAERLRLARDLHDSTGQAIVGITMRLAAIENGCADDGLRDQLQDVRQSIETVGRDLHYLAVSFRERPDEAVSLSEGLARLAQGWTERTGIPIHSDFDVACLDGLPRQIGTVVYRIVQEALTNVAKHARTATAVTLRITLSRGTVRVSIQDDGPGFVVGRDGLAAGEHRDRLGLLGMRERLAEVAGHLRVVSEPGRGTIVAGIIPCWNPGRRDGQA